MTKNDMARVVVQALFNLTNLPTSDDRRVKKQERCTVKVLEHRYELAHKILTERAA